MKKSILLREKKLYKYFLSDVYFLCISILFKEMENRTLVLTHHDKNDFILKAINLAITKNSNLKIQYL